MDPSFLREAPCRPQRAESQAEHSSLAKIRRQKSEFRKAKMAGICGAEHQRERSYVKKQTKNLQKAEYPFS